LQEIGSYAFQAAGLVSITIPSKVETLGILSFERCENLQTVNFSDGIKGLELYCFEDCTALENIYFEGNAPRISNDVFKGVTSMVYFPAGDECKITINQKTENPSNPVEEFKPAAVTNLKAVPYGMKKVRLTWSSSSSAEGYLIYAQKHGKYGYVGMTTKCTAFTDTKALDADYNYYWVFPYITNSAGKMIPGGTPKYVYAKGVIPAVLNLKPTSVKGGVKLTWTKRADATGYLIYGIRGDNGKYGYIGMTTKGTTFTDTKAYKTQYNFYWVFPYHTDSNGKMIVGGTPKYVYGRAK